MSVPKEGKFIRNEYGRLYPPLPEPPWARVERVGDIEKEIDWIKTHIDNLQGRVSVLEITPLVSTWVEEELENIKNMPSERVCSSCKWGIFEEINRDEVWCHYDPEGMGRPPLYWCSHWCEK
jgi:hypothetical protein